MTLDEQERDLDRRIDNFSRRIDRWGAVEWIFLGAFAVFYSVELFAESALIAWRRRPR